MLLTTVTMDWKRHGCITKTVQFNWRTWVTNTQTCHEGGIIAWLSLRKGQRCIVETEEEGLASTRFRASNRPIRRQSLYRLRYPSPPLCVKYFKRSTKHVILCFDVTSHLLPALRKWTENGCCFRMHSLSSFRTWSRLQQADCHLDSVHVLITFMVPCQLSTYFRITTVHVCMLLPYFLSFLCFFLTFCCPFSSCMWCPCYFINTPPFDTFSYVILKFIILFRRALS